MTTHRDRAVDITISMKIAHLNSGVTIPSGRVSLKPRMYVYEAETAWKKLSLGHGSCHDTFPRSL